MYALDKEMRDSYSFSLAVCVELLQIGKDAHELVFPPSDCYVLFDKHKILLMV